MKILTRIYLYCEMARKIPHKLFREPLQKKAMGYCDPSVHIAEKCDFKGIENISIGAGGSIGTNSVLWTTGAKIKIGKKVMTGPCITIITGNHRIDLPGKFMADVTGKDKLPENDQDVVWIGANATILKGVTIAEGCVIAAAAVVTKSTEPYGIYGGVPAKRIGERFSGENLEKHRMCMKK